MSDKKFLEERKPNNVKPPIGLRPKFASNTDRLNEVREAIVRYYDAELKIPVEWIEEYNNLIDMTKK